MNLYLCCQGARRRLALLQGTIPWSHNNSAPLKHRGGVAEDEVDGAGDGAGLEKLPQGVRVQRVLVAQNAAGMEGGAIGLHAQRHRLVLLRPRRVLERDAPRNEARSTHTCRQSKKGSELP